jgi:hypothetical protein
MHDIRIAKVSQTVSQRAEGRLAHMKTNAQKGPLRIG